MKVVAGIDLGGTAINYTLATVEEKFLIEGLCEHPAHSVQGPDVCLSQIEEGLGLALRRAGVSFDDVAAIGLIAQELHRVGDDLPDQVPIRHLSKLLDQLCR